MSGADLEYQRLLRSAGVSLANSQGYDGAYLEQLGDQVNFSLFNVKEYGAVGDGVVDDRPVVQSLIDTIASLSTKGSEIFFPPGTYLIGSPGLVIPENCQKSITFSGVSMGGAASSQASTITRNGAYVLLSASGTGMTNATIVQGLTIRRLTFRGNDMTATLVDLRRCAGVQMTEVRMVGVDGHALYTTQLWNSRFTNCLFEQAGKAADTKAAVYFTSESEANSNANTVQFVGCQWEGNYWTDLELTGVDSAKPATAVIVTASKFERSVGYCVHARFATGCVFSSNFIHADSANENIRIDGSINTMIVGNYISGGSSSSANYMVHVVSGLRTIITGNSFITGTARAAFITALAVAGELGIIGNLFQGSVTNIINDSRSTKTGIVSTNDRTHFYGGIGTREFNTAGLTSAQIDALFPANAQPLNGTIISDSTNSLLLVRQGNKWYKTAVLTQIT